VKQLKCDVLVIGSGIGGTTSASLLSKAGFKTLVVEKLPFAGGRCATHDYHGYKLNTGLNTVTDDCHGALCREVGAEFEIRVTDNQWVYRIHGKDYPQPKSGKGVLKTMIGHAARSEAEADRLMLAIKRAMAWAPPSYSWSLDEWLRQYTDNPAILGMFQNYLAAAGAIRNSELPAGEYFRMMKEIDASGRIWGYLPGGGGQLTDALVKAIKKMGGEVWTGCPAVKITAKDGVATGAVVRKGGENMEIAAQAVVCDAGVKKTVDLAGKELFPPGYLKDAFVVKGAPQTIIYFTHDRPLIEADSVICLTEARRVFMYSTNTNACPERAPMGKHLSGAAAYLESSLPPFDLKKEVEMALQDLRDNIPNFDKYAQILTIRVNRGEWGLMKTWPGYTMPVKTPILGLYTVGDDCGPLGWWCSPAAVQSGREAVADITRRFRPA
jgi:phytoene dehydrogenase-like protein